MLQFVVKNETILFFATIYSDTFTLSAAAELPMENPPLEHPLWFFFFRYILFEHLHGPYGDEKDNQVDAYDESLQ